MVRFDDFEFTPATGELRRDGRPVPLEPQPARALALLVSRGGDLVTRDELRAHLWKHDVHVDFDRGLAYVMSQIRTALGDSADAPRFVQTLPRRGFRFIAPVFDSTTARSSTPAIAPPSAAGRSVWLLVAVALAGAVVTGVWWAYGVASRPARPIVAVAAFDNETGDAQYDTFATGIADLVVDDLTQAGPDRLGVVGNARALRMPRNERDLATIRRTTGAGFVLLAQLRRVPDGLQLLIHLIDLDDGTHLWTHRVMGSADRLPGIEADAVTAMRGAVAEHVLVSSPRR